MCLVNIPFHRDTLTFVAVAMQFASTAAPPCDKIYSTNLAPAADPRPSPPSAHSKIKSSKKPDLSLSVFSSSFNSKSLLRTHNSLIQDRPALSASRDIGTGSILSSAPIRHTFLLQPANLRRALN
ncbi:uncharacterized protein TrAFT101_007783 [Trichoderma asperellum]|uniref:uncharacterized protein n=1 Tax=Trichoderma asperellum TaxID=101201 RepID=UPI0033254852|nr:hypothetical protein TrAFT101_007783 [Trichoderma asperellum]